MESRPTRRNKKESHAHIDGDPFDIRNMKLYIDTQEETTPPADSAHQPTKNTNLGRLQPKTSKGLDQWQQGYMSRQEVSGESKASAASERPTKQSAAKPNYRIPKKSRLESNRLNQLALNISPLAKECRKETDEQSYQPHSRKKGRSLGQISSTRKGGDRNKN